MDYLTGDPMRRPLPHFISLTVTDHQNRGTAELLVSHIEKKIILDELEVKAGYRGRGVGRGLLLQVCTLADLLSFTVVLVAVCLDHVDDSLTTRQLEKWYERYGFKELENYADGYTLIREPKNETKTPPLEAHKPDTDYSATFPEATS